MKIALPDITIEDYVPGALAEVVALHMAYYAPRWGFGMAFETKVARELSQFLVRRRPDTDLFLVARAPDGSCAGSITLDCIEANEKGAHLRWFIVNQAYAGLGLGRALIDRVIDHCDQMAISRTYLTTFAGLHAARSLYESVGFRLVEEQNQDQWSGGVGEQLFVRDRGR